ncbi:Hpt domain-containing protein [Arthrobacter subterraneus]|uniref:Hpt domain-containing protein n=1 Tax=Arthrobacter subterraneus TaxID=335973 RepID=UPI003828B9F1
MSTDDSNELPIVSERIFTDLQADLEEPEATLRFLLNYLEMWDGRFTRLSAAVSAGNKERAMDAVLSVRTSARMIGALRLAQVATDIERHLLGGDTRGAALLLEDLEFCGRATMQELRRRFLPRFDPDRTADRQKKPHAPDPGHEPNDWLRRADSLLAGLSSSAKWEPRLG